MASAAARGGRLAEAERLLREAVALEPSKSQPQEALSWVVLQQNRPIEAIELLDRLLTADPRNSSLATRRAWILGQLGRFDEAISAYLEQLHRNPDRPALHIALGRSLLAVGRDREAVACYRRALELGDRSGEAWWSLANVKTIRLSLSEIRDMAAFLGRGDICREAATRVHFALGKAHEDLGHYEHSFRHYEHGNRTQAETAFASGDRVRTLVDRSISLFTPEFFRQRDWLGSPDSSPIFIVGMPRSGTTLVEQILASHSAIEGTSELPNMNAIALGLVEELEADDGEYVVTRLPDLHRSRFHEMGRRYIEQARPYRRTDRPYFIDKMPSNWQHIGLIHLILPRAKIIDVRRDPLDCCFSNFAQYFPKGHEFTHSLGALGRHYRAYEDLMAHFDEVRPGTVYRLVYEDLVDRPEAEIRKLLAAIDVPFEESCLRFFETSRPVLTPSAQQVRQPINRRGIGRSRPFAAWLAPLQRELQKR
ncbi:MAG TPA: sulfotransferase [Sphingomicrobium sp.]